MRILSSIVLFLCLCLTPPLLQAEPSAEYGKIEMIRDTWGVPHIFSDTDQGAMYGLGYATAEDRALQMTLSLRSIQGRTAGLLGNIPLGRSSTVEFDIKIRTMGFYRAAKEVFSNLDDDSSALLVAYSEGVNDYFADHADELHPLFEKLNIKPEPWRPYDCIASWWQLAKFFAGEGLHDTLVYHQRMGEEKSADETITRSQGRDETTERTGTTRGRDGSADRATAARGGERSNSELREIARKADRIVDDSAAIVQRDDVTQEWIDQLNAYAETHGVDKGDPHHEQSPKFSHAWVVGGQKSTTGSAVLCSDPQTPVRNPSLLYEFHVSGKTFNARGVGVAGSPVILIGWNENVAWGMTALGADQADQFMLKTDKNHPDQYFFDGEWRDMEVWREKVHVKDGDDVELTLRSTHFGPIVSRIAHGVRPGEEVALKRVPMCETDRDTIQGALGMMRSKDVHEFQQALEGWRFPSANVVFGDKQGNIGYSTIAAIPLRSAASISDGNMTHDGTATKYDWQEMIPHKLLPQVINPSDGFILSGNHRSIASFYPLPMGTSTGASGDSDRSWRLRERLQAKETFTPEEVLDIHYDCVNPAKREMLRIGYHLRDILKADLSEDALNALAHLEQVYKQGGTSDLTVPGAELMNAISTQFRIMQSDLTLQYGGGNSGLCYFLKTVQKRLENDPKAPIEPLEREYIDNTLSQAWQQLSNRNRGEPDTWNEQAQRAVAQRPLEAFSTLDGIASLDKEYDLTFPALTCVDGGTIKSQAAQSYTQWVPLHDVDRARSILPIGQSEHPQSPYRLSNYELWSKAELHPAPITRAEVEKIGEKSLLLSQH